LHRLRVPGDAEVAPFCVFAMAIPDSIRQGDWVEALFMSRAMAQGLNVAKPWSAASPYDYLVEADGHTCRVQVKSCSYKGEYGEYRCNYRGFRRPLYTSGDFEFAAIYVVPEDIWYIIPIAALGGPHTVVLWPRNPRSKYHQYEEAWRLLKTNTRSTGNYCGTLDQA
jgi:hypothetical protein